MDKFPVAEFSIPQPSPEQTYSLRWLDNQTLLFDRVQPGFPPKAGIWQVAAEH